MIYTAALLTYLATASALVAASASETWKQLVDDRLKTKTAFAYVENDPSLPNVLIYGDSISIAYTARVREQLKGKANLYRLHCNGNHSGTVIGNMNQMHTTMRNPDLDKPWKFKWDVIHLNVGLHDLKYVPDKKTSTTRLNSTDVYKANLKKIIAYLKKEAPEATLIFATTTPVPKGEKKRDAGSAKIYNAAAMEVLKHHPEIIINDLHAFTLPRYSEWCTRHNNVHFKEAGSKAQGGTKLPGASLRLYQNLKPL